MKNINILKDLNTLNKLHTSSVESHTTNNGIVDFTCDIAGYVDNVVVEGETLVNLANLSTVNELEELFYVYNEPYLMFSNKTYTIVNNFNKDVYFEIKDFAGVFLRSYLVPPNSSDKISLSENECILSIAFKKVDGWTFELVEDNKNRGVVILEGDHTNKPISYFEGLKSVGQGDKIEVLSYSKNLDERLDLSNLTWKDGYYVHIGTGAEIVSESHCYTTNYIPIQKTGCNMVFINANPHIVFYDENKNVIYQGLGYFPSDDLVIVDVPINAKFLRFTGQKSKKNSVSVYYSQYDKKQIPTTLRSLPNGVKDTIEKRGNKYVKVQRCGEHTYNGEDFYYYASNDTIHHAQINLNNIKTYADTNIPNVISNLIPHQSNTSNGHCKIFIEDSKINIMLPTSSYTDEDSIKNYLKDNNFTVVYELATPIEVELPNFNLQTYKGDNTLLINSGVIQCDASFDVCEGIRSELDAIKDKVSSLDDDYIVDIPIQYLNGWEGSLTCRVNGKCVTLAGMLHGQDVAIKSARTNILKLPINSKAINITTIGLYNVFGQYVGTVELTFDNEIKICHSDFTYNGNYIGLNLSWFLH